MGDNALGNINYGNDTVTSALNLPIPAAWTFSTSYATTQNTISRLSLDSNSIIHNIILATEFTNLYWTAENATFGLPMDFENINLKTAKKSLTSLARGINVLAAARIVDAAILRLTRSYANRLVSKQKALFDAHMERKK